MISALVAQTMSLTSIRETTSLRSVKHSHKRTQSTSSLKMDHLTSSTSTWRKVTIGLKKKMRDCLKVYSSMVLLTSNQSSVTSQRPVVVDGVRQRLDFVSVACWNAMTCLSMKEGDSSLEKSSSSVQRRTRKKPSEPRRSQGVSYTILLLS